MSRLGDVARATWDGALFGLGLFVAAVLCVLALDWLWAIAVGR